jgi:hypothetical protein
MGNYLNSNNISQTVEYSETNTSIKNYLNSDIVSIIVEYLERDDLFNFINTANFMMQYKGILFDKYIFNRDWCVRHPQSQQFKHVKCMHPNPKIIGIYTNLISLYINNRGFAQYIKIS